MNASIKLALGKPLSNAFTQAAKPPESGSRSKKSKILLTNKNFVYHQGRIGLNKAKSAVDYRSLARPYQSRYFPDSRMIPAGINVGLLCNISAATAAA